jgi:hypothetical protein
MKIIRMIMPYLQLAVFILFIWVIFSFTLFFLNPKENKNQYAIPTEAKQIVRVDLKSIFKLGSQTLLVDSAKDPILDQLMHKMQKSNLKESKSKSLGIDFLSDCYIYTLPYNHNEFICISFNVINPYLFKNNIPSYLTPNQTFILQKGVGTIIIPKNKTAKPIDIQSLQNYISQLKKNNKFIQTSPNNQVSFFSNLNNEHQKIDVQFYKNKIQLRGSYQEQKSSLIKTMFLEPKGFHLSTSQIPKPINDTLQKFFNRNQIQLPSIRAISINYEKLKIESTAKGFLTEPVFECILDFNGPIDVSTLFSNEKILSSMKAMKNENRIIIGSQVYYIKQINSHTFYFGTNPSPQWHNSNDITMKISGKLSALTVVDGDIWVRSMVQLIPEYKASKNLFNAIEYMNFEVQENNLHLKQIQGELKMKEERFLATEALRFLFDLRLLD